MDENSAPSASASSSSSSSSSSSASSSRARNRRPSPTMISSTTSPAFPTPQQPGHRSRPASSLHISLSSNSNNVSNSAGRDEDDSSCQPSSSTTFTPPSPRGRVSNTGRPSSPMGSPDSTFWGPAPSPISNFRGAHANGSISNNGPATPGGMCEVSSSTVNDVPPSPLQFQSDELNSVTNNTSNSSSGNVMLIPLRTSTNNSSSNRTPEPSTSRGLINLNFNTSNNGPAPTSSASTSKSDSLNFSFNNRNKIKKASSFERFSLQAASNNNNNNNSNSNSGNHDAVGASTEALNGSSSTTTQGLGLSVGLSNNNSNAGSSTSSTSNSFNERSQPSISENPIAGTSSSSVLQASLSGSSSSSTSNNNALLWDAIIKSSGATALRQIFSNSNGGTSSDSSKSLHIKIPSKKLAAKIASAFEQEGQQQLLQQQQQNELINSLMNQPPSESSQSSQQVQQGTSSSSSACNALNLPTTANSNVEDPVAAIDLMNEDVNLMRELSESPLNLTETSANSSLPIRNSRNNANNSTSYGSSVPTPTAPKKIPLTPKQKLLHRMQSGELLSLSPPPLQQQQPQQPAPPPPIMPTNLNFQPAQPQHSSSLLVENLQQPPQHQLDPYYENLLQNNRDEFMPDNLGPLSSKSMEADPSAASVFYDADAYSYYYGNMLGEEIFSTTTTTSSTTAAATVRSVLMLPQGNSTAALQDSIGVDSLQTQTTHRHSEFILGIEDPAAADLHGREREENLQLDSNGQFLDAENMSKNQTESTLRNLLMMGPIQHDDTAWMSADYGNGNNGSGSSLSRTRQGLSGGSSANLTNSWILSNDWARGNWGNNMGMNMASSGIPPDEQDEVMDMSVMDSPEKQKLRHGHLVDHHDIDDVELEASGLPLLGNMPIDMQQPLGLIASVSQGNGIGNLAPGTSMGTKVGVLTHDNTGAMDGTVNPINLQQHRCQTMREDEEPVNLMSANLENELADGGHHSSTPHHSVLSAQEEMNHLPTSVLQHSSVLTATATVSRHVPHFDRTTIDSKQIQCSSGGYITLHAAPQTASAVTTEYNSVSEQSLSVVSNKENDIIDERRIIRVKKVKEGQSSPDFSSSKFPNTPSIILDKPVQPKSIASLPSPLSLVRVNGNGLAVLTARYKTIAINTRFGPVEGPLKRAYKEDLTNPSFTYPVLVMSDNSSILWELDRTDDELCNWMKFVRAAKSPSEQNAVVIEDRGLLYFSTTKEIPPKTELLVGYSLDYAQKYGIAVSAAQSPSNNDASDDTDMTTSTFCVSPEENHQSPSFKDQQQLLDERDNSVSSFTEFYSCFECHEEFPSVDALNFHLENSHREQEAVIVRRPKKKNYSKKSKLLENSAMDEDRDGRQSSLEPMFKDETCDMRESKRTKYDCNTCEASFDTILALTNHAAEHYKQKIEQNSGALTQGVVVKATAEAEAISSDRGMNALKEALTKPVVAQLKTEKKEVATSSGVVIPSKVKCTMCYKSFATKDRLDKHMIVHSDEDTKPLQCEFCPKRFLTNSALAGHIKTHAEEGKCFECPMCEFVTPQLLQLKEHVQTHRNKDTGMFYCPKCSKKFTMYSMVRKHIRAFHGPRQFGCDQCTMCFPTSDKLKLHKLKHSDHREFLCAECGRQFKRKDKLREHAKRMHENKKKIIDSQHLGGGQNSGKIRHSKKFVPKTPIEEFEKFIYKCSDCMMGFKRRGMLVNHLAKRHPEKPPQQVPELNLPILRPTRNYFCPYCDRVYKSSSKRKSHILKSHPGKPLPPQLKGREKLLDAEKVPATYQNEEAAESKKQTAAQQQQYREVSVVGRVMATPHSCQWCHRQYATRAKLLQHQRKAHLNLMPPDMQYPRTQKNNVNRQADSSTGSNGSQADVHINNLPSHCGNVSAAQVLNVPVVQLVKNENFDQPSSSTVAVALAPDSSTAAQISSVGSSTTTPASAAVSTSTSSAPTTAITLNEQQLQQLQIHHVGTGEDSGNVIGFLLTTTTVNADLGTLLPSEFVVVPISQQQQAQQQEQSLSSQQQSQQQSSYPVLSAATMNAIHQTIINVSGNSGTTGATVVPMNSNNNNNTNSNSNVLCNVISNAVSGVSAVNPILSPAE